MAHDFAKTRTRRVPEQKRPEPAPQPAKGLLLTGLLTGLVLGVFISFLIYISGILPPMNPVADTAQSSNTEELAAAQLRRNEELEQAAARLQLEAVVGAHGLVEMLADERQRSLYMPGLLELVKVRRVAGAWAGGQSEAFGLGSRALLTERCGCVSAVCSVR